MLLFCGGLCGPLLGAASAAAEPETASVPAPSRGPSTVAALPPNEPPGVPTPGPQVLAGRPALEGVPLAWNRAQFSTADYLVTGAAGALTLAAAIVHPLSTHPIKGGILFDDAVHDAVRSFSPHVRYDFRDASDVGLSLLATWPFFVDSLASAWWYRGSRDTAEEMALLDLETLAISGAIQGVANVVVSRERPYGPECGTPQLPSNALDCSVSPEFRSFFSGHAAFSFTSAALICGDHAQAELLGDPWDAISCAGGYVAATATASFRVLADVHYTSDVLVGAMVGTLVGYGVPFLHRRHLDIGTVRSGSMTLTLVPSAGGASVVGSF
jgi:membrane-associated phospholipid phosphatase